MPVPEDRTHLRNDGKATREKRPNVQEACRRSHLRESAFPASLMLFAAAFLSSAAPCALSAVLHHAFSFGWGGSHAVPSEVVDYIMGEVRTESSQSAAPQPSRS